jgi:hypothetical protein
MSRTKEINERTGQEFPKKSRRKLKDKKYFGNRYGDGSNPNAKKGEDFINDGYPLELRHKSVIKQKIQDEITGQEIDELMRPKPFKPEPIPDVIVNRGDTLDHTRFGKGKVIEVDGEKCVVLFDDGIKRHLITKFAGFK